MSAFDTEMEEWEKWVHTRNPPLNRVGVRSAFRAGFAAGINEKVDTVPLWTNTYGWIMPCFPSTDDDVDNFGFRQLELFIQTEVGERTYYSRVLVDSFSPDEVIREELDKLVSDIDRMIKERHDGSTS